MTVRELVNELKSKNIDFTFVKIMRFYDNSKAIRILAYDRKSEVLWLWNNNEVRTWFITADHNDKGILNIVLKKH